MKKSTIWILGAVMSFSFLILLFLQLGYIEEMVSMRREQFNESVRRGLTQACKNVELAETRKYLEADVAASDRPNRLYVNYSFSQDSVDVKRSYSFRSSNGRYASLFELNIMTDRPSSKPKATITRSGVGISQRSRELHDILKKRYVYQRSMLDEVIYNMLYTASDKPLRERVNFKQLDHFIKTELLNNGIEIPFHFTVTDRDGNEIFRCSDYESQGKENRYSQVIFSNDPPARMGLVNVHFPTLDNYIYSSVRFMIPSVIFTLVLLVTFIFTIYVVFRQKKLTEIKNDFINNMTHEFKTPISTISLAAQMLNDESVAKSPVMFKHISKVINDETKRLRFQVEKVLQVSMFERQKAVLKKKEVDTNKLIGGVVGTFQLKVERYGGTIDSELKAENSYALVDEMHFTNVMFNLLDNAVKYRSKDRELKLKVSTWNEGTGKLCISVEDNGIGVSKENVKKLFDKFYRVHTGNLHDVKGFGLGLAYVNKIVRDHGGTIRAESELGTGTKFVIVLPLKNK